MNDILLAKGRANRREYFFQYLVFCCGPGIIYAAVSNWSGIKSDGAEIILIMLAFVIFVNIGVRRLHDLGKPGWHLFLMLVPFINIWLVFVLYLVKGNKDKNRYGVPSP